METETIDLQDANAARFRQVLDDMQYRFYRTTRAARLDKPLSYFHAIWPEEQVILMENRFQRELRA